MLIFYLLILPDIPLPSDLLPLWVPSPGGRNHRYAHGPWLAATGCCLPHPCRDGSSFKCLRIIGPSAAPPGWVFGLPSWAVQDLHVFQGPQGLLGWEDRSFSNPRPLLLYSQTTGRGSQNGPHSWHCIYTYSDLLWLSPNTSKCSCLLQLPSPRTATRENICRGASESFQLDFHRRKPLSLNLGWKSKGPIICHLPGHVRLYNPRREHWLQHISLFFTQETLCEAKTKPKTEPRNSARKMYCDVGWRRGLHGFVVSIENDYWESWGIHLQFVCAFAIQKPEVLIKMLLKEANQLTDTLQDGLFYLTHRKLLMSIMLPL